MGQTYTIRERKEYRSSQHTQRSPTPFSHSDSIESDCTISTVYESLPYCSMSSGSWLMVLLNSKHEEAEHLRFLSLPSIFSSLVASCLLPLRGRDAK